GEVEDAVSPAGGEDGVDRLGVAQVDRVGLDLAAGDLGDPAEGGGLAVGEVVEDHHVVSGFDEEHHGVAPDVPGPAGDHDAHGPTLASPTGRIAACPSPCRPRSSRVPSTCCST